MITSKVYRTVHWVLIATSLGLFFHGLVNVPDTEELPFLVAAMFIWMMAWVWGKFLKPKD